MSGGLDVLALKEDDVLKMIVAGAHLGSTNVDHQLEQYVYKRKPDGIYIFNLKKTWEKLLLAARAIAAIENPAEVYAISTRPYSMRAVLKFSNRIGAVALAERFTPGTFTNQIQAAYREPRLIIVSDPRTDHQAINEASYVNVPVIAFCSSDSNVKNVDIAIPCNTKGQQSCGLMWWLLTREVLRLRGTISRDHPWDVMPDLFFYRDPEDVEKEEKEAIERAKEEQIAAAPPQDWNTDAGIGVGDVGEWAAEAPVIQPSVPGATSGAFPAATAPLGQSTEDWAVPKMEDWSANATAEGVPATAPPTTTAATTTPGQVPEWGGSAADETWA